MSRGKRYKSKSDYTLLRNRHQVVPNGTIFENDHMTISKFDEYFSEQVPVYSDSNFKFSVRPGSNQTKKHTIMLQNFLRIQYAKKMKKDKERRQYLLAQLVNKLAKPFIFSL